MENKLDNSISTNLLFKEFDWYEKNFPQIISEAWDEFFEPNFELKLLGLSKNMNCLADKETCFVTKIKMNEEYEMFFRLSDIAVDIILTKSLGALKGQFNINKISELEAKVITSFNDYVFEKLKSSIEPPPQTELKRSNFDIINLTFIVRDKDEANKKAGKFIVSIPLALINPQTVESSFDKFTKDDFDMSETLAKIVVGKTGFPLYEVKNIEAGDLVVFENSSLSNVKAIIEGRELAVSLNPNMDILVTDENGGGEEMSDSDKNIWDSIEVEMSAEFDAVKISLGELKNIENGIVVDLASLYNNKVTLRVENKPIASGSLVIVNDRYGVKVEEVLTDAQAAAPATGTAAPQGNAQNSGNEASNQAQNAPASNEVGEEEFDYSDFELEDENI